VHWESSILKCLGLLSGGYAVVVFCLGLWTALLPRTPTYDPYPVKNSNPRIARLEGEILTLVSFPRLVE
jgi:hypothetical protein